VLGLSAAALADHSPGDTGALVATAMAGGVAADAMAGRPGWENLAPLLGTRPVSPAQENDRKDAR
jgi:hypothetical protein